MKCLELMGDTQKANFDRCATKLQKVSCKIFHKMLLNFLDLSTIFRPRLWVLFIADIISLLLLLSSSSLLLYIIMAMCISISIILLFSYCHHHH